MKRQLFIGCITMSQLPSEECHVRAVIMVSQFTTGQRDRKVVSNLEESMLSQYQMTHSRGSLMVAEVQEAYQEVPTKDTVTPSRMED